MLAECGRKVRIPASSLRAGELQDHHHVWAERVGDIHTAYNDVQIREKLLKASDRAGNQVVWVLPYLQLPLLL